MLKIGDKLPSFKVQNQDGNIISSEDFKNKKLVIFFYPQASTPTCTVEACNLRDNFQELEDAGFTLLGISADSVKKTEEFPLEKPVSVRYFSR